MAKEREDNGRLVRRLTSVVVLSVCISYTTINYKVEKESTKVDIGNSVLMSITEAVMSMADEDIVEDIIQEAEVKEDKLEEIEKEVVKAEEVKVEERILVEEKVKTQEERQLTQPSRGATTLDTRPIADENLSGYLNKYVLDVINTYKIGKENPYLLNNDYENYNGVTENLYYNGELLLKAHPSGIRYSHCTGITFEVFFKAMRQRNQDLGISTDDFNGMTKNELMDFALTWYVAKGPKNGSNLAVAIEKYGLGHRITNLEDLRPGDFIDFSRENNTGHTAVFINWIRDKDRIVGFKYWSSQGSTNGISYKEEFFNIKKDNGTKYGNVIKDILYMGRVGPIKNYKNFR